MENKYVQGHAMDAYCPLCETPWEGLEHAPEHIVLESLGGRKKVTGFICATCNNDSGGTWDRELSTQFKGFSTLLGVKRQKGKKPFFEFRKDNGESVRLEVDGTLSYAGRSKVTESMDDTKRIKQVSVRARTHEHADKIMQSLKRKYESLGATVLCSEKNESVEYLNKKIPLQMSFDMNLSGKSLVKSAWAFAFHNKIKPSSCENAIDYLVDNGKPCLGYFYSRDLLSARPSDVIHCVSIKGVPSQGLLLGYVEYFSVMRMVVCLSRKYTGCEFSSTYALNPINGEELNVGVDLEFNLNEMQDIYDHKHFDVDVIKDCLARLAALSYQRSVDKEFLRWLDVALKKACEEYGIDEDQDLSDEEYLAFRNRIVELIMPFYEREISYDEYDTQK